MGRNELGYSLIEMLVAVAIVSITALMATEGFRFGSRAWEKADVSQAGTIDILYLRRALAEWFSHAQVLPGVASQFHGSPSQIHFTTLAPPFPTKAGFYAVRLSINTDVESGARLMAERRNALGEVQHTTLYESDQALHFRFAEKGSWMESWPDSRVPPEMIGLQIGDAELLVFVVETRLASVCIVGGNGRSLEVAEECR